MSQRYMLDANIVSHALKGHAAVTRRLVETPMSALCISAITEGELRFGLSKRPGANRLKSLVEAFLIRVDVLPWTSRTAGQYGPLRAALALQGKTLGPLDTLIAAHAREAGAVLVTNDKAFAEIEGLPLEDWTLA